jgi:LPXTG-motif cell wall-anchored protein
VNCDDFTFQQDAQAVLDADPDDPNGLDEDRNGIACESLPSSATSTTVVVAIPTGTTTPPAGGQLPRTGTSPVPLTLTGSALAALGAVMAKSGRRRSRARAAELDEMLSQL